MLTLAQIREENPIMSCTRFFASMMLLLLLSASAGAQIIDHTCLNIDKIPPRYLERARQRLRIAYGHTSHGSQLVSGMNAMRQADPQRFAFTSGKNQAQNDSLSLWDYTPKGDLGNPDRTTWAKLTDELLSDASCDRNVIMWSWCGQAGTATEADIETYLSLMNNLEKKYPKVKFVYMTGHLDGTGENGNLCKRNQQIRDFCRKNRKLLFDFADIESYDPDGKVNFAKLNARDDCSYRSDKGRGNWAEEWIARHPNHNYALPDRASHTHPLNGAMKGRAFWWMAAVLAGWQPGR